MDARAAASAWVDGWSRAWPAGDAELVASLYVEGAVFRSHPFREPQTALAYARWAFAEEDEQLVECRFGEPVVEPPRAAVEYWALLRRRGGGEATLAGIAVIRFRDDGRVVEQRDYWDLAEGRRPPNFH